MCVRKDGSTACQVFGGDFGVKLLDWLETKCCDWSLGGGLSFRMARDAIETDRCTSRRQTSQVTAPLTNEVRGASRGTIPPPGAQSQDSGRKPIAKDQTAISASEPGDP